MPDFRSFWGKARPRGDALYPFHPAWAHGLDVAAAGAALIRARPGPFETIARRLSWDREAFTALWLHLLALHDVGKFSPLFQAKVPDLYPKDVIERPPPFILGGADPGHPAAGFLLLRAWLDGDPPRQERPPLLAGWSWKFASRLLQPILGHHGRPVALPREDDGDAWRRLFRPPEAEAAAFAFWETVNRLLPVPEVRQPALVDLAAVSWPLAGLTALADWIGSDQSRFPYIGHAADVEGYWAVARQRADAAVAAAGLAPAGPGPLLSFATLTGLSHPATEAQAWAAAVSLPEGPLLALIEDVTGGGKTEAALMLAHRLLAGSRATGVFFALPTMATANAMFARIAEAAPRLYATDAQPSLTLAHGRAALHPRFRRPLDGFARADAGQPEQGEEGDSAASSADWLMGESRRALLAGLAGKVLIVDEAHSYDAYMGAELDRLVAFHAAQGGSTIILSATLPRIVKARLAAAWRDAVGERGAAPAGDAYPGATLLAPGRDPEEVALAARADLSRALSLTRIPGTAAALQRIASAAAAGACVAWVRNTVDDAIEGAAALRETGIEADLFHARFAMGDRLAIEARVLERFGRTSRPDDRRGRVLVATQVIEQSLDLDFDLVVTDLAPIDLLLQRAGRLWRHAGRPRPIPGPELVVAGPDPAASVEADWYKAVLPRAAAVYPDHALLWRSARALAARPLFRVPEDVRAAIETVYRDDEDDIPPALLRRRNEARGKASAERAFAEANLLAWSAGYRPDVQAWQSEAKVATRLAEESRRIRLARVEAGRLVPWHPDTDPRLAWALSEVTAYERKLRGRHLPEERFRRAAEAARTGSGWNRYDEDVLLLPLEEQEDEWVGVLVGDTSGDLRLTYSPTLGLRFS